MADARKEEKDVFQKFSDGVRYAPDTLFDFGDDKSQGYVKYMFISLAQVEYCVLVIIIFIIIFIFHKVSSLISCRHISTHSRISVYILNYIYNFPPSVALTHNA